MPKALQRMLVTSGGTIHHPPTTLCSRLSAILVIILFTSVIFLPPLGTRVLYISDESRFALLAQDLLQGGQWLLPKLRGEVYMNKPPLYIWMIAGASRLSGGVTEFTAQLPAALSAIATALVTFLFGERIFNRRTGLWAAVILSTTIAFYWHGLVVLPDMTVTFFMTLALYGFWRAVEGGGRFRWLLCFYGAMSLAVFTKGPVGLMPLVPAAAWLIWRHGGLGFRQLALGRGLLVLLLFSLPWLIPFLAQGGKGYLKGVLGGDYLSWYFQVGEHRGPVFFALGSFLFGLLPWSPFLPWALWTGWRGRKEEGAEGPSVVFLLLWLLLMLFLVGFSTARRTRYLLPLYPPAALLVAWLWDRWDRFARAGACTQQMAVHAALWLALSSAAAAGLFLAPSGRIIMRDDTAVFLPATPLQALPIGILVATAGIFGSWGLRSGRIATGFWAVGLSLATLFLYVPSYYIPRYNRLLDVKGFSRRIEAHLGEAPLRLCGYSKLSYDFYLRRPLVELVRQEEIQAYLAQPSRVYCLAEEGRLSDFKPEGVPGPYIVERMEIGGRAIVLLSN